MSQDAVSELSRVSFDTRRWLQKLSDALSQPSSGSSITMLVMPAPVAKLEQFLAEFREEEACLWAPREGVESASIGVCAELRASGPERFDALRSAAAALWPRIELRNLSRSDAPSPRLFGGFSFQAGGAQRAPWSEFGDARFVLPILSYWRQNEQAFLSLAVSNDRSASGAPEPLDYVRRALRALDAAMRNPLQSSGPVTRVVETCERGIADWTARVAQIRAGIARGDLEKLVLARRVLLTMNPAPDPLQVLARLRAESPYATRFAFRRGPCTFLGATPERLVAKSGLVVQTEALAGSQRTDGPTPSRELLESRKDRAEHAIVVREIVRALEPLCTSLSYPEHPVVRELRHVLHLLTPIEGRLRRPEHVLALVSQLHPTPAVGGVPRPESLSWIREHEPDERGWYAGPVGWFDAAGDGEFAVALRSGVLEAARAHLYVGAGIVSQSDADREFAETALKLRTLLAGLGAGG